MFFSGKLLKKLVIELAVDERLSTETVQNLIYHLKMPGTSIPNYIASVIAEKPEVAGHTSFLPGRLAFGILDDALLIFNPSDRYSHQKKLCKKVEYIDIGLKRLEQSSEVIQIFDRDYSALVFAAVATSDLGTREGELSKPELAILVERLFEAFLLEMQLTTELLRRVVNHLQRDEKNRLENRLADTIREGISNAPWDDTQAELPLFQLDEPVRFRQTLLESEDFEDLAWQTLENVTRLCRH
jgi:hypothetical protein